VCLLCLGLAAAGRPMKVEVSLILKKWCNFFLFFINQDLLCQEESHEPWMVSISLASNQTNLLLLWKLQCHY